MDTLTDRTIPPPGATTPTKPARWRRLVLFALAGLGIYAIALTWVTKTIEAGVEKNIHVAASLQSSPSLQRDLQAAP